MQQFIDLLEESNQQHWDDDQNRFLKQQCEELRNFWQTEPFDEILTPEILLDSAALFDPEPWTNYLILLAQLYIRAQDPDMINELLSCRYSYLTPLEKLIVDNHLFHPTHKEWK